MAWGAPAQDSSPSRINESGNPHPVHYREYARQVLRSLGEQWELQPRRLTYLGNPMPGAASI